MPIGCLRFIKEIDKNKPLLTKNGIYRWNVNAHRWTGHARDPKLLIDIKKLSYFVTFGVKHPNFENSRIVVWKAECQAI